MRTSDLIVTLLILGFASAVTLALTAEPIQPVPQRSRSEFIDSDDARLFVPLNPMGN